MKQKWDERYGDDTKPEYKAMAEKLAIKLMKVLRVKSFAEKMRFSEGSIIVEFAVVYNVSKNGFSSEDPEKLLRNSLKGELKDLNIYPDSMTMSESYSGVKLTDWQASAHDCIFSCHKYGQRLIKQTRACTEIDASCEGIPLTKESCCKKACRIDQAKHRGLAKANKVLVISCVVVAIVFVIAVVAILTTVKRSRRKYVSTSPSVSTSSLKQLANNDQLQKC